LSFRICDFVLVSDFDIRVSDFFTMPHFTFTHADLFIERGHTRLPVTKADLEVVVHDVPKRPAGMKGSDLINGKYEVTGELAIEFPSSQNRLRPGMEGVLRVPAPDGRVTRLPVLVLNMGDIEPSPRGVGYRIYHWPFLALARPAVDAHRLLPTPDRTPLNVPNGEITLEELLYQLGGEEAKAGLPAVRLNSEGGFAS
jgi:hypothetical protein